MAKAKCNPQPNEFNKDTEFGRGEIKDNALKAVVTSQLFRTRVVKAKKGKGSFKPQNEAPRQRALFKVLTKVDFE